MMSSANRDYDGDGDVSEGIYYELSGLKDKLLETIRRYGVEKNAPLCYSGAANPYWFKDTNGDGSCVKAEAVGANAYKSWTARLAKAAFNYQMASKDPGAFAHNAKYIMELLYDSVTSLNSALVVKSDLSRAVRGDRGHFDGSSEAARHWDSEDGVDATCSRCHGGQSGFRFFAEHGVTIDVPETANGLECGTCHTSFGPSWDLLEVKTTSFPGGTSSMLAGNDNLCSNCHSGRVAKADIDRAIASQPAALPERPLPSRGGHPARRCRPRRLRIRRQDLRRAAQAHGRRPVHVVPRPGCEQTQLSDQGRLGCPLPHLPRRRQWRTRTDSPGPPPGLRRGREHDRVPCRRDGRYGGQAARWR